jgi:hypothetical protein
MPKRGSASVHNVEELTQLGDKLFGKRLSLLSMWQEVAENFYPERADFTVNRTLGDQFADNLTTSYPVLVRRDLGNSFSTMMRPSNLEWFHMGLKDEGKEDHEGKEWLEYATGVMRRAMYDRASMFTRASKEADHDMAAFGQSVKSIELNSLGNGLLYRCWHLRDCAWCENAEGTIDTLHRKWKITARDMVGLFRDRVHHKVMECLTGKKPDPYREYECRHIVMPAEQWDETLAKRYPFVSLYIDCDNKHLIEAVGQHSFKYVIPRWQTVSGSQYAFSPATVCGLPDARLLQAMARTLLEAGEKAVSPPMIGVQQALRSDVAIYPAGITWVDAAYDERLGEVLRPLTQDKSGIPAGFNMQNDLMGLLREAFFLNALTLPQNGPEMTAYEVGQRVQEYIRQASPIFEPLEDEDNGAVCEATFELMMRAGAFGSVEDIPESIRGSDIAFRFESPLHDAVERKKGQTFMEAAALIGQALPLDPTVSADVDVREAFRDVLSSIGVPAKWMRDEDEADKRLAEMQAQQEAEQLLAQLGQGADIAKTVGEAGRAMAA